MTKRILLPPDHPQAPKYWMNETSGILVPAVERLIRDEPAVPGDNHVIRAYLSQWIDSPVWDPVIIGGGTRGTLDELRRKCREIRTRDDIHKWTSEAVDQGIDPF